MNPSSNTELVIEAASWRILMLPLFILITFAVVMRGGLRMFLFEIKQADRIIIISCKQYR